MKWYKIRSKLKVLVIKNLCNLAPNFVKGLNIDFIVHQWVETNPSNIRKHPNFPYGHLFLSPHSNTLTALDTDVCRENTDVRWVGFHPPYNHYLSLSYDL